MQIDDLLSLARSRRSCRVFKAGPPISDEIIQKILDTARWAQSGANAQPWEFIVIRDLDTIKKLSELSIAEKWDSYHYEQICRTEYRQPIMDRPPQQSGWEDVSVLIVVCGDRRTLQATTISANSIVAEGGAGAVYIKNMANATQILQLSIAAAGLASRWVSVTRSYEEAVKRLLGVPDVLDVHTIIPIGYPAFDPASPYRRELEDIVHFEKYDMAKYRSVEDVIGFITALRNQQRADYHRLFRED